MCPGAQYQGGVDHVGCPADAAQLSGFPCPMVVERFNADLGGSQKPREPDLPASIAPNLAHHPGRHGQRMSMRETSGDEGHEPAVVAFEGDERARGQGETRHLLPPARLSDRETKRPVGGTTFRGIEGTARLGEHVVEEGRKVIELDLLLERRCHIRAHARGTALAHGAPGATRKPSGQADGNLLCDSHTASMTPSRSGRPHWSKASPTTASFPPS